MNLSKAPVLAEAISGAKVLWQSHVLGKDTHGQHEVRRGRHCRRSLSGNGGSSFILSISTLSFYKMENHHSVLAEK